MDGVRHTPHASNPSRKWDAQSDTTPFEHVHHGVIIGGIVTIDGHDLEAAKLVNTVESEAVSIADPSD